MMGDEAVAHLDWQLRIWSVRNRVKPIAGAKLVPDHR